MNRSSQNTSFYELTPDVVIGALESSGFSPTGYCLPLNSYENRVYDFRLNDGSHVVGKFYRPGRWSSQQIQEEHDILFALKEAEINVCTPLLFPDGRSQSEVSGIIFALWSRTGGRALDELNDNNISILGRMLARIHNVMSVNPLKHRLILSGQTYGIEPLHFLKSNDFLPNHLINRYEDKVLKIVELYKTESQKIPMHGIHGDCHLGNLLFGNEGWSFLDFDDCVTGPAVQDVWMMTPARDEEGLRQRQIFIQAYRTFRDFNDEWLGIIELLRALRYIRYSAWIAQRWEDPSFQRAFPHFGTKPYWEEETEHLEDQLDFFLGHKNLDEDEIVRAKSDMKESEELTNKDYFFDWEDK